jgi:hypothetical protein
MKGTLTLVIVAAIATWAFLFFPLDTPKGPRQAGKPEGTHDATPRPSEPVPKPDQASQAATAAQTSAAPARAAETRPAARSSGSNAPGGSGDVVVIGATQPSGTALGHGQTPSDGPPAVFDPDKAQATGELGEGILSPDYKLLEESYVHEPRDGPWASQHEAQIREALYRSDLREDVVIVHCQSTVCRIHLNPRGKDPFADLVRVPDLAAVSGLDSSTPYSLNGTELIVYARPENAEPSTR